jgi:hypothetical protein
MHSAVTLHGAVFHPEKLVTETANCLQERAYTNFQYHIGQKELLAPKCYQLQGCHVGGEAAETATLACQ